MQKTNLVKNTEGEFLSLRREEGFVFHGSPKMISLLSPRQAFDEGKKDGKPAVFATPVLDIAVFRALINTHRGDVIEPSKSRFGKKDDGFYFEATNNLLDAAKDAVGYVHVLDGKQFVEFNAIQCKSYDDVRPLEVVEVTYDNLPLNIEIISP